MLGMCCATEFHPWPQFPEFLVAVVENTDVIFFLFLKFVYLFYILAIASPHLPLPVPLPHPLPTLIPSSFISIQERAHLLWVSVKYIKLQGD